MYPRQSQKEANSFPMWTSHIDTIKAPYSPLIQTHMSTLLSIIEKETSTLHLIFPDLVHLIQDHTWVCWESLIFVKSFQEWRTSEHLKNICRESYIPSSHRDQLMEQLTPFSCRKAISTYPPNQVLDFQML